MEKPKQCKYCNDRLEMNYNHICCTDHYICVNCGSYYCTYEGGWWKSCGKYNNSLAIFEKIE